MAGYSIWKLKYFSRNYLHHMSRLQNKWTVNLISVVVQYGPDSQIKAGAARDRVTRRKKSASN